MADKTRKDYITLIWIYEKRAEEIHKQYKAMIKRRMAMKQKIEEYKRSIKRIDNRQAWGEKLVKTVNEYFSLDIRDNQNTAKSNLARNIYYKYAMEQNNVRGANGAFFGRLIGRSKVMPARGRRTLTSSFKSIPENREVYHAFKKYADSALSEAAPTLKSYQRVA